MRMRTLRSILALALLAAVALLPGAGLAFQGDPEAPPPNFKVAFIGDSGIGGDAEAVLQLIEDEGAGMVIHAGDFGYGDEGDPDTAVAWDAQISRVLGEDFPYFAAIGNHDDDNWSTYQRILEERLGSVAGATCSGDYGVMAACSYQGLFFILSGVGTLPDEPDNGEHEDYIREQLAADDSLWSICSWHKNQEAMQVGGKNDAVGWGPYEACREGRAIIATGHEHSYSRTKTLSNVENQTGDPAWDDPTQLRVGGGSTFVFVSGLGGKSIRDQERCQPSEPPYGCGGAWASIYTGDQSATHGALFIEFYVDGDPAKARGYFKDIDGNTVDTFTVTSDATGDAPPPADGGDASPDGSIGGAPSSDVSSSDDTFVRVAVALAAAAAVVAALAGGVLYVKVRARR